jgi:acyl-CoA thioesterase
MRHPDNFGLYLDYRINPPAVEGDLPTVEMTIEDRHLSSAGVAHGGAVFSLMDFALGAVLTTTRTDLEQRCSTVGMHIEYLAPVPNGTVLTVHVSILHRGRSLARLRADAYNQDGKLLAYAIATFNLYYKKKK